jgi:hypothetical protein
MGKQSKDPTYLSQEEYDSKLKGDISKLINKGFSDEDILLYGNNFKSSYAVKKKEELQSTAPNQELASVPKAEVGSSATVKPSSASDNIDNIGGKNPINKNLDVANKAYEYALQNLDKDLSAKRLNDEEDNSQFGDVMMQGLKDMYNFKIAEPLTKLNAKLGGNKDFKLKAYKPLEREIKEAEKQIKDERGQDAVLEPLEVKERARKLFIQKDTADQLHQLIDEALPSGYDREGVWNELKLKEIRSNGILRARVASAEVFKAQINEFDEFRATLTTKEWQSGLSQEKFDKYNLLSKKDTEARKNLTYLSENFDTYLEDAKTDGEKLELFKYNYNDWEKDPSLIWNGTKNIFAATTKILADTSIYANKLKGSEFNPIADLLSEMSSDEINENRSDGAQFYRYKASSINNWSDLGSFGAQLISEQIPVLASIYFGGNIGIAAVSLSSGGQQINELEEQEKQPFGRKYSDGRKIAAGLLYAGAEYFPEKFGTARILKDFQRTISSASTASRRLYMDSFYKNTFKVLGRTTYYPLLEGGTELITAESQITIDKQLLGIVKTDAENNELRSESFISGVFMGETMSVAGGVVGFAVSQAKLYSDRADVKAVQALFANMNSINSEIESNADLTDLERTALYQEINVLNNKAFDIVEKNANKGIDLSLNEKSFLLDINESQADITAKYEELKKSNFSKEYKEAKAKEFKAEFNSLEQKRNATLNGEYTSLTELSDRELISVKNKAQRELMKEKNPDGDKTITINDDEITKRAIEINNKEQEAKIAEKKAETPTEVDEVEVLRAEEQVELREAIPNSEQYITDGKVDETKLNNPEDKAKFDEIYDKYDKLIAPKLQQNEKINNEEPVLEGVRANRNETEGGQTSPELRSKEAAKEEVADAAIPAGEVELKNEGFADAPTKENVTERLGINNPFYKKVSDALVKLGLIEEYNPETGEGDVVGGYAQKTSTGGFSAGEMLFDKEGNISYSDGNAVVNFDKNGNVISENTNEVKAQKKEADIQSKKDSIALFEKTRDAEDFKYITVNEYDALGNKKKVRRLKTAQELKESTDKINGVIDKAKTELEDLQPQPKKEGDVATPVSEVDLNNLKNEEVSFNERDEFDNLLSGEAQQRRKDGKYTRDGVEFVRQEAKETPKGRKTTVKFADEVEVEAEFTIMDAKDVQPSHLNGKRNPNYFITEAQPKNRRDSSSIQASDKIGQNPKLNEVGDNSNAYSGAPVVNERGEVIQGNNRAEGLKKHYKNKGNTYKEQLKAEAKKFGLTEGDIDAMENPILVRKVSVNDSRSIELGNYDVKDIETGGTRRIDPVATSRRIPNKVKSTILDILFKGNPDMTLNEAIKAKLDPLMNILKSFLNPAQIEGVIRKSGEPNPKGIEDVQVLIQTFLFDGGNVNLSEQFESLSSRARNGVLRSLPKLFTLNSEKSIVTELQNAISAVHSFVNSGTESFNQWVGQADMFNEGKTPKNSFNELELAIAEILVNTKTEKEIKVIFDKYHELVTGRESDMFSEAVVGLDKKTAVERNFKVKSDGKRNDGKPENQVENIQDGGRRNKGSRGKSEVKPSEEKVKTNTKIGRISEKSLPNILKKGETKKIALSENVEAEIKVVTFFDGTNGYSIKLIKNGKLVEDKNGDTETEFLNDESLEAVKFLEAKKRGYELSGKPNKNKSESDKENQSESKRTKDRDVTFTFAGSSLKGVQKPNGDIVGIDGTKYSESMVKEVKEYNKAALDKLDDILKKYENDLNNFGKNTLGINMPIAVAKTAIKAMRAAVIAAKLTSEVIKAGIDAIKNTNWYKNLSKVEKNEITENNLESIISESVRTNAEITDIQARRKTDEMFDKADKAIENKQPLKKQIKKSVRKFIQHFTDRQFVPKKLMDAVGAISVKNLMINSHGASGKAKRLFDEAYSKIYFGLSAKDRKDLDRIIQLRRFITIDKNRELKDLDEVVHPDYIDGETSRKSLNDYEKNLGAEKFLDLNKRADVYFKTYSNLLEDIYNNGLITKEAFDSLNGLDYQPRLFLEHITDFEGSVSMGGATQEKGDTGGLSGADVLKRLKQGSSGSLITNSEWLLSTSIVGRMRAMSMNNINKQFIKIEFPKANKRFNLLNSDIKNKKSWSNEDKRFYEYFQELNTRVIDNPILSVSEDGVVKRKYEKAPNNFKKAYWYDNGNKNEFFIEESLHDLWFDNLKRLPSEYKEVLSYISGSALLKGIATGNNPAFAIVNTPRDFMFNVVFSDQYSNIVPVAMYQVARDTFKAIKEIRKSKNDNSKKNLFNKYIEYGGDMAFLSTQGQLKKNTMLGQFLNKTIDPRIKDISKGLFDAVTLKNFSNYSEIMFRVALFDRSIKNELKTRGFKSIEDVLNKQEVDDIYNSGVANARSLLDFNQGGTVTKDLESVIPYLNTAVQGTRVASDAFVKNPAAITFRVLQTSAISSTFTAGVSLALISIFSDKEEERTSSEIYLDALEGISQYQKTQYFNFVTGIRNKDGEYQIIKVAKNQQLAPILSITDNLVANKISKISGRNKKSAKIIFEDAFSAFNNNISPVDLTSASGNLTRTPVAKAILTYATGFDFYRNEPLSYDIGRVEEGAEGQSSKSIETFYKEIGREYGLSAVRLKGAVESIITTPSTNPFIGMIYGGAEAITSDKDTKAVGEEFAKSIMKSTVKRAIGYTNDFNRITNKNREFLEAEEKSRLNNEFRKIDIKVIADKFNDKEINIKKFKESLKDFSQKEKLRAYNRVSDLKRLSLIVDRNVLDIKYESDPKTRALMIINRYGDLFDGSKDNKKIIKQMTIAKGILTDDVIMEYSKLKKELISKE